MIAPCRLRSFPYDGPRIGVMPYRLDLVPAVAPHVDELVAQRSVGQSSGWTPVPLTAVWTVLARRGWSPEARVAQSDLANRIMAEVLWAKTLHWSGLFDVLSEPWPHDGQ